MSLRETNGHCRTHNLALYNIYYKMALPQLIAFLCLTCYFDKQPRSDSVSNTLYAGRPLCVGNFLLPHYAKQRGAAIV